MKLLLESGTEQAQRPGLRRTLKERVSLFVQELCVTRCALKHPKVPWHAKLVGGCSLCYVFSPIQLIPNFIPVIGQVDDVLVVILGIKLLRRWIPPDVLAECYAEADRTVLAARAKARLAGSTHKFMKVVHD